MFCARESKCAPPRIYFIAFSYSEERYRNKKVAENSGIPRRSRSDTPNTVKVVCGLRKRKSTVEKNRKKVSRSRRHVFLWLYWRCQRNKCMAMPKEGTGDQASTFSKQARKNSKSDPIGSGRATKVSGQRVADSI